MKVNHVLIDYENVQPALVDAFAEPVFKVWVFIGAQQAKVKIDLLDLVQRKAGDARVVRIAATGRNALDFHMSYYLGEIAAREPESVLHVITKDTGLDPLIAHLRDRGIDAARWGDVFDIPIVKVPATVGDDEKLSRVMAYLIRRGSQRPASLKTLTGSIAAVFQPRLSEPEVAGLIEQLRAQGVIEVNGTKLQYSLPE